MTIEAIKKICFVGAGTMGSGNSMVAAASGYSVTVYDPSDDVLRGLKERYEQIGKFLADYGYFSSGEVDAAPSRITLTSDAALAARDADLLSESVPEQLDLKRETHRKFDALCPDHTILTTNTSFIPLSDIALAVQREERFAALHYHLASRLVDIMKGPRTSPDTTALLKQYVLSCRLIPIVHQKERPGYLYNSLLTRFLWAAVSLVIDQKGTPEDVDRAWMAGMKPWSGPGPFGMIDAIGIDVFSDATRDGARYITGGLAAQVDKIFAFLKPFVDQNMLGAKNGRGFYSYPDPAFGRTEFALGVAQDNPHCRMLATNLIANALMLVIDGYADFYDVDRSWMIALEINNAQTGPFGLLDQRGLDLFLDDLREMPGMIATEDREKITGFLKPYIQKGTLGMTTGRGFYAYPDPDYLKPGFLTGALLGR